MIFIKIKLINIHKENYSRIIFLCLKCYLSFAMFYLIINHWMMNIGGELKIRLNAFRIYKHKY